MLFHVMVVKNGNQRSVSLGASGSTEASRTLCEKTDTEISKVSSDVLGLELTCS